MIVNLLLIMLSAVLIENFIFSRFFGICPFLGVSEKPSTALGMGCAVMFVMTLSNIVTTALYKYVLEPYDLAYLRTVIFILVIAALVQLIEMFLKKSLPALYQALGIFLPLITTNCAVLGAAIDSVDRNYSLLESAVYGFSAALGFTMALLLFAGVRDRMKLCRFPKAFEGTPALLIAAGLIAMAFSGFSGISIG